MDTKSSGKDQGRDKTIRDMDEERDVQLPFEKQFNPDKQTKKDESDQPVMPGGQPEFIDDVNKKVDGEPPAAG